MSDRHEKRADSVVRSDVGAGESQATAGTRIEPGRLWLDPFTSGDSTIGPITVPREVSRMCKKGWDISGTVVKTGKGWRLLEVWNVSP